MKHIEFNSLSTVELEGKAEILKKICDSLDPFSLIENPMKEMLAEVDILEWEDPFQLSNHLIFLMENTLQELNTRKKKKLQ
jgi:hypothetical protein